MTIRHVGGVAGEANLKVNSANRISDFGTNALISDLSVCAKSFLSSLGVTCTTIGQPGWESVLCSERG